MIFYCVYEKVDDSIPNPTGNYSTNLLFHDERFTKAREFILNKCKDQNVVMIEEDIKDGEVLSFSYVPTLAYTIC